MIELSVFKIQALCTKEKHALKHSGKISSCLPFTFDIALSIRDSTMSQQHVCCMYICLDDMISNIIKLVIG